jgi:hypothetical protein
MIGWIRLDGPDRNAMNHSIPDSRNASHKDIKYAALNLRAG